MKSVALEFDELEWLPDLENGGELEAESTFNFNKEVPASVRRLLPPSGKKDERLEQPAIAEAIRLGDRNENHLSDIVFFNRHPERNGSFIQRNESNYTALSHEWLAIRDSLVRPALSGDSRPAPRPGAGETQGTVRLEDVAYLALEGGGGKGVTYLGAVQALEQLGVLPIDISRPGTSKIKGISGASAGAITALLLALGLNSDRLKGILENQETFTGFLDGPESGNIRSVNRQNQPTTRSQSSRTAYLAVQAGAALFDFVIPTALLTVASLRSRFARYKGDYAYNLLFDRGLCPGFAARNFIASAISTYLGPQIAQFTRGASGSGLNGGNLNFGTFYRMTGVDLYITGVNVTKRKAAYFSRLHTPLFPVAEAVGISMSFPFVFKPVYVESAVSVGDWHSAADEYEGFWLDGGVLNNLPIHAFDQFIQQGSGSACGSVHPNVVGLRLTEAGAGNLPARDDRGEVATLWNHLQDFGTTYLDSGEEGQIRTPEERAHTIDLYTEIGTLDFAPAEDLTRESQQDAKASVLTYFSRDG